MRETMQFAIDINPHTIQVSLAAPYPGTELYPRRSRTAGCRRTTSLNLVNDQRRAALADQLSASAAPTDIYHAVEIFYRRFYFRPRKIGELIGRDDDQLGDDQAAPARGRGVLPLPACARRLSRPSVARTPGDRFLIVTADDFGLHEAVNEAVRAGQPRRHPDRRQPDGGRRRRPRMPCAARASCRGCASGCIWCWPTARRCCRTEDSAAAWTGAAASATACAIDGARYFLSPRARRQLEAEIRAQFEAFAATGLALDHVNAHKHFHLHPTLLALMLRVGRDFGLRAVRYPHEPARLLADASLLDRAAAAALGPWLLLMRRRLRRAGVAHNDQLYGIGHSGAVDEARLIGALRALPPGLTEIYLHPATRSGAAVASSMSGYRHAEELAALLSPRVRALLTESHTPRGGYSDWLRLQASRQAA